MHKEIIINSKELTLLKPLKNAHYDQRTVLTDSSWEYVELWLKRNQGINTEETLFYWQQAKHFYQASLALPEHSRPLTAYYCILNATKALLSTQRKDLKNIKHGIHNNRNTIRRNNSLSNAKVTFMGGGVLKELSEYLGESIQKETYTVQDLLYNIPCIHRCFCLTYKNFTELFIPIRDVKFVYDDKLREGWIEFKLDKKYSNNRVLKYLPPAYKKQENFDGGKEFSIRKNKKRMKWNVHLKKCDKLKILSEYHGKVRKDFYYIYGNTKLWYIKKQLPENRHVINRSSMPLIFAVMHWLSELVRYDPRGFEKYFSTRQNWLLHEFIEKALDQFIDEISCEITKEEIMSTGFRK